MSARRSPGRAPERGRGRVGPSTSLSAPVRQRDPTSAGDRSTQQAATRSTAPSVRAPFAYWTMKGFASAIPIRVRVPGCVSMPVTV